MMKKNILKSFLLCLSAIVLLGLFFFPDKMYAQNNYGFDIDVTGSGEPIIFLPGLISSGDVWDETVAQFSEDFECHVFTMPGFAGVDPQEGPPYLETWKKGIIQYIIENELHDVTIVGHSLGGFLGLWIGTEDIPNLKQLIIVDSLPFLAITMNPNAQPGFSEENAQQYMSSFSGLSEEQNRSNRLVTAKGMVSDSTRWEMLTDWAVTSDLKTEAYTATELMGIDLRSAIGHIDIPILVLGAYEENPQFVGYTLERMKQIYMDQYQEVDQVQFEVAEDSKHFIMYDQPIWMYKHIRDFMTNHNKTP